MDAEKTLDNECFVICPIGKDGSEIRSNSDTVLRRIISPAVEKLNLRVERSDKISDSGTITSQIITHLLNAKAVVADLTGLNPNVFYELAIRHASRKPTALIAAEDTELPFDVSLSRTAFFDIHSLDSAADCTDAIEAPLRKALESGQVDSPIESALNLQSMQNGSAGETGKSMAELIEITTTVGARQSILDDKLSDLLNTLRPGMRLNLSELVELIQGVDDLRNEIAGPIMNGKYNITLVQAFNSFVKPLRNMINDYGLLERNIPPDFRSHASRILRPISKAKVEQLTQRYSGETVPEGREFSTSESARDRFLQSRLE
ncbi:MAG: hypothetical protein ABF453_06425 [Bifidobacterium psychraerophilum]|uniref:hypothetical protein n=1 Tax=Bifidobacterium psychraerophilum TaxID=218140 RepID=UPI0039E75CE6